MQFQDLPDRAPKRTAQLNAEAYRNIHPKLREFSTFVDGTVRGHRYKVPAAYLEQVLQIVRELPEGTYALGKSRYDHFDCVLVFVDHAK